MAKSFVRALRYRFERVVPYVDTSDPWEVELYGSSRDEWEQSFVNGRWYKVYSITKIGVDSNGFYYYQRIDQISADGYSSVMVSENKVYWGNTSGDFILDWVDIGWNDFAPSTVQSVPDNVYNYMFGLLLPETVTEYPNIDVTFTFTNYEYPDVQPQKIEIDIVPHTNYRFTNNDMPLLVTLPNFNMGDKGTVIVDANSPYFAQYYSSVLNLDGSITVTITTDRSVYNIGEFKWLQLIQLGNFTNLIKTAYDVELSLDNITPSNPSTSASSSVPYVNTLSANVGYTMDDVEVVVTMDGFVLDNVYDSTTHTITIPSVTGDIIISASAKKLHTFNFYSMDGLTLHGSITAYSIKDIEITLVGNTRTITVGGVVIASYTVVIPSDYGLFGLSTTVNSTRVVISTGYLYRGTFATNTNFYEVVAEIPVPSGDLSLTLYHNRSEKDVLFKDLQLVSTMTGTLRESCDIINPQIMIEYSGVPDFDYVYIPYFNRYYYVTDIVSVKQTLWLISLKVDVLMTYKDIIKLQTAHVSRNEFTFDNDKRDSYVSFDIEHEIVYKPIQIADSGFFDSTYVSLVTINAVKYDSPVIKEV